MLLVRFHPPDSPPCQPTKLPPNHHVCISLPRLQGPSTNTHPSKGTLHFPAPLPHQYTGKLGLPGSQHNRELEGRSETETGWIFSMRTRLPKEKGISSAFLLKAVILCFVLARVAHLSLPCTILMIANLRVPTPIYRGCMHHPGGEPFAVCLALGCGTVQMNKSGISTTAGTEFWL